MDRWNFIYADCHGVGYLLDPRYAGAGLSRNDRNAITDFIRDYPYEGGALDAVKEEVRQELEEFKKIITAEPPERAIIDLKEGEITVFDWWSNEPEYFPRLGKLAIFQLYQRRIAWPRTPQAN
jgi:hypothetical protein